MPHAARKNVTPRLLFLYMVPNTGHQKAADAIIAAVQTMDGRTACVGVDVATNAYPVISGVFNKMYLRMLQHAPVVWDYLYDNPDVEALTRDARGLLTLASSFRTRKLIDKHRPAAVICTQAVAATAMAAEKKRGYLKAPLVGVVTDFGVHSYWIHHEIDLYLVGHANVRDEMVKRGVPAEKVRITGIPVHPRFAEIVSRSEARRRIGVPEKGKAILMMGGSRGLGLMDEMLETAVAGAPTWHLLVVCGHNRSFHRRATAFARKHRRVRAFGYVKDTSVLMSAADVVITKPGGLTCSEALAKGLPLILTNPIPGQEERNVDLLVRSNVASVARTPDELGAQMRLLRERPTALRERQESARTISRPRAASEAARLILDLVADRQRIAG